MSTKPTLLKICHSHAISLLDELDDDLMLELDQVVRQNQCACLPFAKSGRAEAELFQTYPELPSIIERERQAKLDSMMLQSRARDQESRYGSISKGKAVNIDDSGSSPFTRHSRPGSSKGRSSVSKSPLLKARSSAPDLIFEMDEGSVANDTNAIDSSTSVQEISQRHGAGQNQTPPPSLPLDQIWLHSEMTAPAFEGHANLPVPKSPLPLPNQIKSDVADNPFNISQSISRGSKPWGSAPLGSHKLDMKDIMAQASLNRVSNISSGLSHQAHKSVLAAGSVPKISQKARKKQQQQQPLQPASSPEVISQPDKDEQHELDTVHLAEEKPKFSWQMNSPVPKVSLKDMLSADEKISSPAKPTPTRTNSPLTLRQTVPGNTTHRQVSGGEQQPNSLLNRSVSSPAAPQLSEDSLPNQHPAHAVSVSHQPTTSFSMSTTPGPIRSIRHYSGLVEQSLQLPMAEILSQQQTEKDIFREASAKRSLQEIQEEQAFQEWWDEESRKMRMEEEAREVGVGRECGQESGARVRGRGMSRGRGQGRGRGGRGRGRGRGDGGERRRGRSDGGERGTENRQVRG